MPLGHSWNEGSRVSFTTPQVVLTVIENQVLVWLGAALAPLLPLLGALSNVLHFGTQKLLAMHAFVPPKKPYSASRTSTIAHGLMLGACEEHSLLLRRACPAHSFCLAALACAMMCSATEPSRRYSDFVSGGQWCASCIATFHRASQWRWRAAR